MKPQHSVPFRSGLLAGSFLLLAACGDGETASIPVTGASGGFMPAPATAPVATSAPAPTPTSSPVALGLMEVTISGLGGDSKAMIAEAAFVPTDGPAPKAGAAPTDIAAGIDLKAVEQRSVDVGDPGTGTRYVTAIFKVRNAQFCRATPGSCTPYTAARQNLTLLPAATAGTINGTPFARINKFDGTPADPAFATRLLPTHGMTTDGVAPYVQAGLAVSAAPRLWPSLSAP